MTGSDEQRQFPPMAISDLVVLTLVVAFAYACVAPPYQEALSRGQISAIQAAPDLIDYLGKGLLLFGLIVLARQRFRGHLPQLSPGQWIIVAIGPYTVLALAGFLTRPLLDAGFPRQWRVLHACDDAVFTLVIGLSAFVTIPAVRRLEIRWKIFFWLIYLWLLAGALWCAVNSARGFGLVSPATPLLRHLMAIDVSSQILAGAAMVAAVSIDATKQVRRDWLHYIGVVAMLLIVAHAVPTWGWSTAKWWQDLYYHLIL
jgi:hypothetical protein